ncbi:Type IV conjugative transfer system protein TraV [Delftia sp. Cs1-4]|uniref:TraV family lipoprotein n=1 Tax=Delftia sp. (strain Cs1-4) TaxID=742013 RepID=UPI00020E7A6D|nr:TraV family lipoprotein [Delftia sp. Cs1-4]AEF88721.1 Type IV conjugative transfer system protein TraV [Delftia sp. Cs1-4]
MSAGTLRAAATALLLPLAGCVNMSGLSGESKYACAAPEGVACDSVSGTYANALHENLPSQRAPGAAPGEPAARPSKAALPAASAPSRQPPAAPQAAIAGSGDTPGLALRSQARVLRLWTKPWEDADGDLWDQGLVYVQVDAGRWQIDHIRQRIRDQYAPLRPPPAAPAGDAAPSSGSAPVQADGTAASEGAMQRAAPLPSFPLLRPPSAGLGNRAP